MSEKKAEDAFIGIRYAATGGEPYCHHCGCRVVYKITRTVKNRKTGKERKRRLFKCAECLKQFSATSGTIFASRKLEMRDILFGIAIFINGAKGNAALNMSRNLNVQYKTAFVLEQKLREALGLLQHADPLAGEVEIDAAYYGGYVKPSNEVKHRRDRRKLANQSGRKQAVTIARSRGGRTRAFVKTEKEFGEIARDVIATGSILFADEAKAHDYLHAIFDVRRINHEKWGYADGEVSTNQAESMHSRMRRAEFGTHHHIAGPYLGAYADEMTWREDHRRISNGEQFLILTAAGLNHPVSRQWKGYWQRRRAA